MIGRDSAIPILSVSRLQNRRAMSAHIKSCPERPSRDSVHRYRSIVQRIGPAAGRATRSTGRGKDARRPLLVPALAVTWKFSAHEDAPASSFRRTRQDVIPPGHYMPGSLRGCGIHTASAIYLCSRYSFSPWREPSRPRPDCLMPPNGATSVVMTPAFTPTIPYSSASATLHTRERSRP